ncbi:MAG: 2-hydroxyacid dehydrogenase [Desulfococcaceae bacterium]
MDKPKVLITHPVPRIGIELLKERFSVTVLESKYPLEPAFLREKIRGYEGLITLLMDRVDEPLLAAAEHLKVVANHAVGYENIDVDAVKRHRVMATNTPGVLTHATAEIAFALLICLTRRILEADRYTREGRFTVWDPLLLRGDELYGKHIGIIGMGRIGFEMARRCRAFGMNILYYNRNRAAEEKEKAVKAVYCGFNELLERAHVVSLHVPSTSETRHLIDSTAFDRMRDGVYLINTARGEIVDEAALIKALKRGKVKGAGLDVYEFEPEISPGLFEMEKVVLLPHIGSATMEARDRMSETAARNMIAALEGKRPPNLIPELADMFAG